MKSFKSLADLQKATERKTSSVESTGERFFTIQDGKSFRLRFRQELTEDSKNFDDENGTAVLQSVHSSPTDFRKSAICTADSIENGHNCWACEQITKDAGWKAKNHLMVNVAIRQDDGEWVARVLDHKLTPAHVAQTLIEYAAEYDTIMDRDYKISRNGVKQATNYNLIPFSEADADESIAALPLHDLSRIYKVVPYAEQESFYLGLDSDSNSTGEAASGWK